MKKNVPEAIYTLYCIRKIKQVENKRNKRQITPLHYDIKHNPTQFFLPFTMIKIAGTIYMPLSTIQLDGTFARKLPGNQKVRN